MTDERAPEEISRGRQDTAPGPGDQGTPPWVRPLGAAVAAAVCIALLGFAGFYLYELGIGASDSPVRVIMSVVLFLLFALAAAAMSRGWLRGDSWPVTATLVVGALLLPTAWTLLEAEQFIPGVLVAVVAVFGVYAGWKGRATASD